MFICLSTCAVIFGSLKRIELDDRMFIVDSDPRAHGLFEVDFYTLYLKPVEAQ